VPLHRLPPHPGRRPAHVRPAGGAVRPRRRDAGAAGPAGGPAALDYAAATVTPQGERLDHFHAPRSADELAALRLAKPQARLLAGSTDVGLWVNKQFRDVGD
jgi:hypothetical protein